MRLGIWFISQEQKELFILLKTEIPIPVISEFEKTLKNQNFDKLGLGRPLCLICALLTFHHGYSSHCFIPNDNG